MSGKMRTARIMAAALAGMLVFGACGKKEEEVLPEIEPYVTESDMSEMPLSEIEEVDPNESYAAQVQAELGDVEIPTTDVTTKTDAVSVPSLSQTLTTPDGTIQIKVPGTWTDLNGQLDASGALDGYIIQTGSMSESLFLIYSNEPKSEDPNAAITSIDEYSGWLVQFVSSATSPLQGAEVVGKSAVRLTQSTLDGKKTVLKGTFNQQEVVFFVYAVEGSTSYHQFCCWAPAGIRNAAEATFDAVINSFSVLA